MNQYVRICPVCDTENPPERVHCSACGSLLAGVDFSLWPEATPALAPESGIEIPVPDISASTVIAPPALAEPATALITCPAPDCGQSNPPGSERCLYCNQLLEAAPASSWLAPPDLSAGPAVLPSGGSRTNLPPALAAEYRIVAELQAAGSEADLLIVEPKAGGEARVAKLYRRGIQPDSALLARLADAGTHVVKLYGHGVSDGVAWELMEYCRAGNLRELMQRSLLTRDTLRRMVVEMAAGLEEIHARRILHRDLKPENLLIRQREPLNLVLTDFGIASLAAGTRHFTDSARTVKYAAPEALTGIIDPQADWWSVGMILLEAASGRHPFDGLSEQVINHHLATRPVEVTGVADAELASLCRGLLLRDPAKRWGAAEVARWLRGDPSLELPVETGAIGVRPYCIGTHEARSAEELALALASHWQEGVLDLRRGLLREWLKEQLHDFNLTRRLADIMEARDESDDRRLLRFLLAAAPQLPPIWQGQPAHRQALLSQARLAQEGGEAAGAAKGWLDSLFENEVLALFARAGHADLEVLDGAWRQTLQQISEGWEAARSAYRSWSNRPRGVAGNDSARVVNFDAVVYGRDEGFNYLPRCDWHAVVLLAEDSPWFARLAAELEQAPAELKAGRTVLLHRLLAVARSCAQQEQGLRQSALRARAQAIEGLRQELSRSLGPLMLNWDQPDEMARREMRQGLAQFQALAARSSALDYPEEAFETLLRQISALQRIGFSMAEALDQLDEIEATHRIGLQQERLSLVGGIVVMLGVMGPLWLPMLALGGLITFAGWRFHLRRDAQRVLEVQLQLFQRQAAQLAQSGRAQETPVAT